ncbi:MAG: helix-turn-helix transcriptional regulator [Bacteroidota bacterium]
MVGNRIRELRIASGYSSLENFATDHGFSRKGYWEIENGGNFKLNTLIRIVEIHRITIVDFFRGIELEYTWQDD